MRIIDILAAPRYATERHVQWFVGSLLAIFLVSALLVGIRVHDPRAAAGALMLYSAGIGFFWWLWLSGLLLIARDAQRLRLPTIVRTNAVATVVYALATIAAPVIATVVAQHFTPLAVLFPGLAIAACLAWMLLPRWFAMWLGFLPAIYIGLHNVFHVASPFDPRFQHWAWLALLVLTIVDGWRWHYLLHLEDNDDSRWSSSVLLQMRRNTIARDWFAIDRNWAWRHARGRKVDVDFHGVCGANPGKAVRVALGGLYVPRTTRAWLKVAVQMFLPLLFFGLLMLFMNVGHAASLGKVWKVAGVSGGLWVGLFGIVMLTFGVPSMVMQRWRSRADMAVLALLPHISTDAAGQLVRTILRCPSLAFIPLWLCSLAGVLLFAGNLMALVLITLVEVTLLLLMVMTVLRIVSGLHMGWPARIALGLILVVLGDGSFTVAFVNIKRPWSDTPGFEWLMVVAWLVLIAWAAWQARFARHALQQHPHPFLASER